MSKEAIRLIHGISRAELSSFCEELDVPAYRVDQVWNWLYRKYISSWDEMKNVPADLAAALSERFCLGSVREINSLRANDGTRKILVELSDGECVEEVLIPAKGRETVCVSTQVGCKFDCAFCASGKSGYTRDLDVGEMVGQVVHAAQLAETRLSHVVYMGVGEPLDNYSNVLSSIRLINDGKGLGIGARRITVSTCGLVPGIEKLASEGLQVELSVSLHTARDGLRSELMPVNAKYPLVKLLAACRNYVDATNRIITFEYLLIAGLNDSEQDAVMLVKLLSGCKSRVNLIPLSPVSEYPGVAPSLATVDIFMGILEGYGINATIRRSRGKGVAGACGQLRGMKNEAETRR